MRTALRVLGALAAAALVLVLLSLAVFAAKRPRMRPASSERIDPTPPRLARGRYLVENVCSCLGCHSDHDAAKLGFPVRPGTEGRGGMLFDARLGVPGVVFARNITSDRATGLGAWTDGEALRALREGVDRSGRALFPVMPYREYHLMADEDARAVVAFLRTLPPLAHEIPARKLDFPANLLVKWSPAPVEEPIAAPDPARDRVTHGGYLVALGGCKGCHTPRDARGRPVPAKAFQGGWEMRGPWGRVVSSNLTPDVRVFMGSATKAQFVARFRSFASVGGRPAAPGRNTVMPWGAMSGMTEADLGAVYDFLRSLPPAGRPVAAFPDAEPEPPPPPGAPVAIGRTGVQ